MLDMSADVFLLFIEVLIIAGHALCLAILLQNTPDGIGEGREFIRTFGNQERVLK